MVEVEQSVVDALVEQVKETVVDISYNPSKKSDPMRLAKSLGVLGIKPLSGDKWYYTGQEQRDGKTGSTSTSPLLRFLSKYIPELSPPKRAAKPKEPPSLPQNTAAVTQGAPTETASQIPQSGIVIPQENEGDILELPLYTTDISQQGSESTVEPIPQDTAGLPQAPTIETSEIPQSTIDVVSPAVEPLPQTGIPTTQDVAVEGADVIPQSTATATQLDPAIIKTLLDMAEWWKKYQEGQLHTEQTVNYRPEFIGKSKNSGIRVSEELIKKALEKAKMPEERPRTGGCLGGLIEHLLWSYVGFDRSLVVPESQSNAATEPEP